jgi:DNA excision repair protein ERCC-4
MKNSPTSSPVPNQFPTSSRNRPNRTSSPVPTPYGGNWNGTGVGGQEIGPTSSRKMDIIFDSREPVDHPWLSFLPAGWTFKRDALETGDLCAAVLPDGIVVERKAVTDLLGCMTSGRERFERELRRGRHLGKLIVVIEGSLLDVLRLRGGISEASVLGTVAAWERRFGGFLFAGSVKMAALLAFRLLAGQIADIEKAARLVAKGARAAEKAHTGDSGAFAPVCVPRAPKVQKVAEGHQ